MGNFSDAIQGVQRSRAQLQAWVQERDRACATAAAIATAIRLATNELDTLPVGQSLHRIKAEGELRKQERSLQAVMDQLGVRRDVRDLACVESSDRGIWIYEHGYRVNDWSDVQQAAFWRETAKMERLAENLNDDAAATGQVRFEADQARQAYRAAMRRSAISAAERLKPPVRASGIFAALPFLTFLLVAAVGGFFAPRGVVAWIAVGVLLLSIAVATWGVLREGANGGVLAGLGAAGSLALFTAAYIVCVLGDATSIVQAGRPVLPIAAIGEASLVALTVGVTGGTLGTELDGAARIVAFVQILLTISGVAAVLAFAWRRVTARVWVAPDEQHFE